jgi:hypothetical protein
MKKEYNNTQCQKCGENIGWLGRFNERVYKLIGIKNIIHNCK